MNLGNLPCLRAERKTDSFSLVEIEECILHLTWAVLMPLGLILQSLSQKAMAAFSEQGVLELAQM